MKIIEYKLFKGIILNAKLIKRALKLSYFTIIYNIAEGILAIFAGLISGSISLIGFGLDSAVESFSAVIMVWRFKKSGKIEESEEEEIEKRALKYVGYTFLILGTYVLYESLKDIYTAEIPEPSLIGIIIAIASIIIMPFLFYLKYRTGKELNSRSLIADSKQTLACAYLSAALLFGLLLNYIYGIWQADSLIGILIAIYLFKEGYKILSEK
jgi:divalent metal cation (Fe/Co/Zn/Cd) transporter